MDINKLTENLKKLTAGKHFPMLIILTGITVMLLIMFSGSDENDNTAAKSEDGDVFFVSDNFTAYSEKKITELLSSIEGVGKNKVMVTLSGTEEYVFAEEVLENDSRRENSYVIYDRGNGKEALVRKVNNPCVNGIVVVCEGGDDPKICEQVYRVISTAFNIPTNRIYVAEMK